MIAILGAGPTGLGAAYRLQERGVSEYVVIDAADRPGGLATSYVDDHGFTWDVGGHVQFSHYRYYDEVLDRAVTGGWLEHERDAAVWIKGRWVPYPFQYNLHRLPKIDRDQVLGELATLTPHSDPPGHFREWIDRSFGPTLASLFLVPYNLKVWGYPLETLGVEWMGERVATVDLERLRRNIAENRDDVSWGPNQRFRFPRHGGTGAIWTGVAALLPEQNLRLRSTVSSLDAAAHHLRLAGGEILAYDRLISSVPLDRLCGMTAGLTDEVRRAARALTFSAVHVLGVGLRGRTPAALARRCWMYFPEPHSPYYRVTVFTNYSPHNAPADGEHWSLMAEVCETAHRPVHGPTLQERTLRAMRADGLLPDGAEVVSFWHRREEHGYPTPFAGRDDALAAILPALERFEIYSRGRFGAWKYEVANQDHSFMQGVELVDRLLGSGDEPTLNRPHHVNSGAFRTAPAQRLAL
jgi:protoporphyrinogen oxidase